MRGERDYYSVEEAAEALRTTPARVLEMMASGELEGLPPGATAEGVWKVLLPVTSGEDPAPEQLEQVPHGDEREVDVESPAEPLQKAADVEDVQPQAASAGGPADEIPDEGTGESDEVFREDAGRFGWTTTKQAAKVLGVSRRSVQSYVRRGILEAREEGEGVNKRFLISIDSLNTLLDRRRSEADDAAKFSDASAEAEQAANLYENTSEALRHAIERVEARTAEATELRIRLQITEQAESTLRAELEEERRRRIEAERARDRLRRALEEGRKAPPSEPSESPERATVDPERAEPRSTTHGPQEAAQPRSSTPWWRRMFGG